eukprot:975973-Amphidinium_carterae.1
MPKGSRDDDVPLLSETVRRNPPHRLSYANPWYLHDPRIPTTNLTVLTFTYIHVKRRPNRRYYPRQSPRPSRSHNQRSVGIILTCNSCTLA